MKASCIEYMTQETYEELVKRYPRLYKHNQGIECAPGWHKIIDDLSAKLEMLILGEDNDPEGYFYATEVKEKYGTLRFYMSLETDKMSSAIRKAENLSSQTCEYCSKPGSLRGINWYHTLCDTCDTEKNG